MINIYAYNDHCTYSGLRLLSVVCPNVLSSPSKSPWKLMGSTIVREIIIIISIKTMMWRWKERYCTASGPHFIKMFSSLHNILYYNNGT